MNTPWPNQRSEPAGLTLAGEVRSAARVLPEMTLTITDRTGAQVARTTSGPDGRFRFTGLGHGSYIVIAAGTGYRPRAEVVELFPGREAPLRLALEPAVNVHGLVYDRGSGGPVAGATVSAVGAGGQVLANTVSDQDGGYRITGIDAAELTLVASAAEAEPVATVVRVAGEGPQCPVDLPIDAHSRITGTVTAGGTPVAGLPLTLLDERGETVATAVTDADGTYVFDGVQAGTYTVHSTARAPRAMPIPPEATIADLALRPR